MRTRLDADIVVAELPTVERSVFLGSAAHTILRELLCAAEGHADRLYDGVETNSWELRLDGRDFFPFVLSPLYQPDHPRFLAWPRAVLAIQPEASFTNHGVSSSARNRRGISRSVEEAFKAAGRRYFGGITRASPKALRVVKAESEDLMPIRWWLFPLMESESPQDVV